MTLEFVVITTGRFGSVERTLIITEALHAKVPHLFGYSWYNIFVSYWYNILQ